MRVSKCMERENGKKSLAAAVADEASAAASEQSSTRARLGIEQLSVAAAQRQQQLDCWFLSLKQTIDERGCNRRGTKRDRQKEEVMERMPGPCTCLHARFSVKYARITRQGNGRRERNDASFSLSLSMPCFSTMHEQPLLLQNCRHVHRECVPR